MHKCNLLSLLWNLIEVVERDPRPIKHFGREKKRKRFIYHVNKTVTINYFTLLKEASLSHWPKCPGPRSENSGNIVPPTVPWLFPLRIAFPRRCCLLNFLYLDSITTSFLVQLILLFLGAFILSCIVHALCVFSVPFLYLRYLRCGCWLSACRRVRRSQGEY